MKKSLLEEAILSSGLFFIDSVQCNDGRGLFVSMKEYPNVFAQIVPGATETYFCAYESENLQWQFPIHTMTLTSILVHNPSEFAETFGKMLRDRGFRFVPYRFHASFPDFTEDWDIIKATIFSDHINNVNISYDDESHTLRESKFEFNRTQWILIRLFTGKPIFQDR